MKKIKLDKVEIAIIAVCFIMICIWSPVIAPLFSGNNVTNQKIESQFVNKEEIALKDNEQLRENNIVQENALKLISAQTSIPDIKFEKNLPFVLSDVAKAEIPLIEGKAGLSHVQLSQYQETVEKKSLNVILQNNRSFATMIDENAKIISSKVDETTGKVTITYAPNATGLIIEETWQKRVNEKYGFDYRLIYRNTSTNAQRVTPVKISLGTMPAPTTTGGMFSMFSSSGADIADVDAYAINKNKLRTIDYSKTKKGKGLGDKEEAYAWVALHSKYFIGYLQAETIPFSTFHSSVFSQDKNDYVQAEAFLAPEKILNPGESVEFSFKGYIGPKDYDQLSQLGEKAVSVLRMDLFFFFHPDWMGWLSRKILISLVWIRGFFPFIWGYGAAIILITIIIKMLFWPLTHHSTVSMHRMQQIQPKMKELQEKYKDNKEVLNAKVMELYREYKVNPFGGCLPILLQMPVFFALFNTLRASIELRHAEFFWVKDLAMPDVIFSIPLGFADLPICPLAIMMGVTMVWQQMITPTAGDPKQAKMMKMMTLFFVFLLYGMPSGLTLYWTVNQVLSIVQSYITNKKVKQTQIN